MSTILQDRFDFISQLFKIIKPLLRNEMCREKFTMQWLWFIYGVYSLGCSAVLGRIHDSLTPDSGGKKGKGSPYSITERRVPELISVLSSQPAGDVSHKPGGRLPLLSVRPAVTLATLMRAATNFSAWWTEAQWVWTVCLRLLPDSVANALWTRALLRLSPAR